MRTCPDLLKQTKILCSCWVDFKPYNWKEFTDYVTKTYDDDMSKPEKMVMIGDEISLDMMFGHLNNMACIWL